jgi:hypothetical protein
MPHSVMSPLVLASSASLPWEKILTLSFFFYNNMLALKKAIYYYLCSII